MPPTRRSTRPTTNTAPYSQANGHRSAVSSDIAASAASSRSVRSTRNPRILVEPDSDIDDELGRDDDEDEDIEDKGIEVEDGEDEDDDDQDEMMDDAEDDDDDDDDDDEADVIRGHPPPPKIQKHIDARSRPTVVVKPPSSAPLKSVEAKEMEDAEDGELSELDSEDEDEDDEDDGRDQSNLNEGDDEDIDIGDVDEDALGDTDDDGSPSGTPDPNKLTRRQRGQFDDFDGGLMALSNEAQKKKYISAEEHAMRRAEMARRRKNLSEKRNEEEKIDTINKLLKKPAPKRRSRAELLAAQLAEAGTPGFDGEEGEEVKADPLYTRWISNASGSRIGVPVEWLQSPVAAALADSKEASAARNMIRTQEVA